MAQSLTIRPLCAADLTAVVAIDAAILGRSRPGFMEKRLASARENPRGYVYVAADRGDRLAGFIIARLHEGEYGEIHPVAVLDAMGVDPAQRHAGIGHALFTELERILRHKGVAELLSQLSWADGALNGFFNELGFCLAPRRVLELDLDALGNLEEA